MRVIRDAVLALYSVPIFPLIPTLPTSHLSHDQYNYSCDPPGLNRKMFVNLFG
jgi:hypothetical protein